MDSHRRLPVVTHTWEEIFERDLVPFMDLLFHRPGDAQPFFLTGSMPNCHSLAVHPGGTRLVVAATNANSAGNGRVLGPNKEYPGNVSPLHVWDLPNG